MHCKTIAATKKQKAVTLEKFAAEIMTLKETIAAENWQIRRARLPEVPGTTCMSSNLHRRTTAGGSLIGALASIALVHDKIIRSRGRVH